MIKHLYFITLLYFLAFLPTNLYSTSNSKSTYIGGTQPVFSIQMDNDGYLWYSSRSYIYKYAGKLQKQYTLTPSNIILDGDGREIYLRKSAEGKLWAFTNSGKIYFYDSTSDLFILFAELNISDHDFLLFDLFWNKSELWLATSKGLLYYDKAITNSERKYLCTEQKINSISRAMGNNISLNTDNGLILFDIQKKIITDTRICSGYNVTSSFFDAKTSYLWIGSFDSGLIIWDLANKKIIKSNGSLSIPHVPVRSIKKSQSDKLLIGLDGGGVYKIDTQGTKSELFISNDDNHDNILLGNGVYDILVDNNNIWIGTYSGGLTLVKESRDFDWIKHIPHNEQSIINNHINAIHEDKNGNIWYATNSGVSLYKIKEKKWKHFLREKNGFLTLCQDNDGRIWTGGYSTGLYCISEAKGIVRHIKSLANNSQSACVYASYKDCNGNLWFGDLFQPLTCITTAPNNMISINQFDINQINAISPLNKDTLIITTSNGFFLLDRNNGKYKNYFKSPNDYNIKSNSFISVAISLNGKDIWFGTDGGGLNCFNLETQKVDNYSTLDGLPSNYIYGIVKSDDHLIWVSTDKGIFCFDYKLRKFLFNVNEALDIPIQEFVIMSYAYLQDGRIAFGSRNGAIIFNPKQVKKRELKPKLHFTDFRLFYMSITPTSHGHILPKAIDQVKHITLKHNQNSFSFDFISIDLYQSENYDYSYMLEGFDGQWTPKGKSSSADYTNIPPGKYTFRLKCFSSNNNEELAERKISIEVKQPFWNTFWAWCLYIILFIGLIYWTWVYYKEKLQIRQSEEKIRFFTNVAHDIRTPLSLILSPLDDLDKNVILTDKAHEYLKLAKKNCEKLFSLVSQLLDFQQIESSHTKLNITSFDLNKYLISKLEQFESLANSKSIAIIPNITDDEIIISTDVSKLDSIIDNLLSNAVKYSSIGGTITLHLKKTIKRVQIDVEDNGIGIPKKSQKRIFHQYYRAKNAINSKETGSGIGLVFTQKTTRLLKGKLSFSSQENVGSTFTLLLPMKIQGVDNGNSSHQNEAQDRNDSSTLLIKNPTPTNAYKLLLVEDNDDMRIYLEHTLSSLYKVYPMRSAEEALNFLKKKSVDFIISDVMMEGISGYEFCSIIKQNIETSHIPVVLLTALGDKDRVLKGFESGADDYITKPFDVKLLKIKINNLLNNRKKLQNYYMTSVILRQTESGTINSKENRDLNINNLDEAFMKKCVSIVSEHISDNEFTINELCREIAMSRTLVYEKLKRLTDQSPNEFIRAIRMRRAKDLLETNSYSVQEVASMVGFTDTKYFSTVFKKYYGESPSQISNSIK